MNKHKLFLNMIVGDFESPAILRRSLDSIAPFVDGIYITLTYGKSKPKSSHRLVKLLKEYGANLSYFKWCKDFSQARQFALDQVPSGPKHYVYWHDTDDVLVNAESLSEIVSDMVEQDISAVYFDYWYQVELDKDGEVREVLVLHKRERVIRHDHTWQWVGALHETLIEQKQENLVRYARPECYVVHLPSNTHADVNIDRNIEILERTARKQKGKDPRTLIYLAKAYFDKAKMTDGKDRKIYSNLALRLFHDYLEGGGQIGTDDYRPASGWSEERASAYGYVAEIAILSQEPEIAIEAYHSALKEAPQFPNYYVDLAMAYLAIDDFQRAKHWLNVSTSVPMPTTTMITFPRELKVRALEVSFQVNLHEGKLEQALEDCVLLQKIMPNEKSVAERLKKVKGLLNLNKACQSAVFLGKYLESVGEEDKIPSLVNSFSSDMQREKFAAEMRHKFVPPRTWGQDEVAILCGPGWEEWTPDSIETGLGGSEEAVVYLSQELKKKGWKVTVFANPGTREGDYDGVRYDSWYNLNPLDSFNVLVLWRNIGFVDTNPKAKLTLVWLHDVPNNPDFTRERVEKVDKIMVLSEYHQSLLRMHDDGEYVAIPEKKIFLTGNGIPDLSQYEWGGHPQHIIYASSPDRGLEHLLTSWDAIRQEVPDAQLHIYYGFDTFDQIHHGNPERMKWKQQILTLTKQPGITFHGRVGHHDLHVAYTKCGVWAYPTHFTEISCISGMKAQALGAVPVTTALAALDETVKNGIKVDVDIVETEAREEYVKALVRMLKDADLQDETRKNMIPWARDQFSWSGIANAWDSLMRIWTQNPEMHMEIM